MQAIPEFHRILLDLRRQGHRQDICPQLKANFCYECGHDKDTEPHDCQDASNSITPAPVRIAGVLTLMIDPDHPYFVGVQFHPEYISRPLKPSPPYMGLVLASCGRLNGFLLRGCRMSPRQLSDVGSSSEEEVHEPVPVCVEEDVTGVPVRGKDQNLQRQRMGCVKLRDASGSAHVTICTVPEVWGQSRGLEKRVDEANCVTKCMSRQLGYSVMEPAVRRRNRVPGVCRADRGYPGGFFTNQRDPSWRTTRPPSRRALPSLRSTAVAMRGGARRSQHPLRDR
ncbi:hypothetical protein HPB51_025103 [Rhipicephalus microplus]|uniref:CTP synthase (glutamine hydrolyzing) n=1 Tax=Rhipicephalus microplus TaxID=6941 RepID=A0A9J6DK57_RHIMP|nr:hypothetical protein HPB51_025103 [Rhipicephalus microplus]